ncbi:sigma-70 family RNA polymerase sigma factor [Mycolicibacterium monacense]|uniref:RNA polymerase sigma factor n=1 Tax=Mycolicibacterium monacense TaxID=85693 RepID=A0AAD1J266_MYCMB|nr:sigma-70 family RNA polymerase sigma factor [Mycolicibacterium monacense]MDA4102510.1 RNA polymerase sigma 70 [Mycolicibacterium monacense DSM 44395]ORB17929.1 RNA polymerase subunit sigma-70 [Mycolicibacterium monacense DSM 44395]QHP88634.1 sigma-70 family RNA polymerase sigma factor [Mycolicibacterium monacense DSM 44395]BBZ63935.1 RNA polymerase sigma factor [Mycolicibacterium monacense]
MKVIESEDIDCTADLKARFAADVWPLVDVLLRGARRLTHNDADAEDLLQETLVRAYTGFHNFQPGTNLQAWLFRIQYNQWVSAYRWKERRPAEVLSDEMADFGVHLSTGLRSAESEVIDSLPDDEVREALGQLSEGFRTVLYYADVEGYTYAETAALMGIPIGTVMSRVSRARVQLRRLLADSSCARGRFASGSSQAA